MSPLEQEGLLTRQVAALRRRGVPHDRALELAAAGLPVGPLRARVEAARRGLAAGAPPADPLAGEAERLEHAALAIDARLHARDALRTTRAAMLVAIVVPLAFGTAGSWALDAEVLYLLWFEPPLPTRILLALAETLRWGGIPLIGAAVWAVARFADRVAPGFRRSEQAAALLDAAGSGREVELSRVDRRYYVARRARVGAERAAAETARELTREAEATLTLFRQLAPVVGATLAFPVVAGAIAVLTLPILVATGAM